jgi:hypothetical protein
MAGGVSFVLVHSPLTGPDVWQPVAAALRGLGAPAQVAELREDGAAGEPYWARHARSAAAALQALPAGERAWLVGHSGAGALLPLVREAAGRPAAGYLFVDAGLPRAGSRLDAIAAESAEFAAQLRASLAAGERFPAWSDAQLAAIVPDAARRRELLAGVRPRGLDFFAEPMPVPAGWPDAPCAYLWFSEPYAPALAEARAHGWPARELPGGHFQMLVEAEVVARALLELARAAGEAR